MNDQEQIAAVPQSVAAKTDKELIAELRRDIDAMALGMQLLCDNMLGRPSGIRQTFPNETFYVANERLPDLVVEAAMRVKAELNLPK